MSSSSSNNNNNQSGKVQWRRFAFFDKDLIHENIEAVLGAKPTISIAEGGMLLFGDTEGNISITDRNFNHTDRKHKAFRGPIRGLAYVFDSSSHAKQFVIAIGEESRAVESLATPASAGASAGASIDGIAPQYFIKIFNAADMTRPIQSFPAIGPATGQPFVPSNALLTSFAVLADGSQITVGFSTGTVLGFVGSFLRDSGIGKATIPIVLYQAPVESSSPIAGLHYCEFPALKLNERRLRLFVVLDTSKRSVGLSTRPPDPMMMDRDNIDGGILVVDVSVVSTTNSVTLAPNRRPTHVVDERGASVGCSALSKDSRELVVGREEGVFTYSVEDRGGAAGFDGEKQCIGTIGRYVLVSSLDDSTKRTNITVYDLRNKYIGMNSPLPSGEFVKQVMQDDGMAYVITSKWALIRFREKDTTEKLNVLLKKFLYPLAISLAAEEQCDISEIMKLYKLYGDHLFKKNEFDAAIAQYICTIGHLQPSYVVRRFLDNARLGNLITYLEKLHEKRLATKDITTLLLTCYTKTKDEAKITAFVDRECSRTSSASSSSSSSASVTGPASGNPETLTIDVASSVLVLHKSGFTGHALTLALHHRLHNLFVQIQLTQAKPDPAAALSYLASLVFEADITGPELLGIIQNHGRQFVKQSPDTFTAVMIKLCLEDYGSLRSTSGSTGTLSSAGSSKTAVTNTVSFAGDQNQFSPGSIAALSVSSSRNSSRFVVPVTVGDIIHLFSESQAHLKMLLEGVFDGLRARTRVIHSRITMTLLELYLQEYSDAQKQLSLLVKSGNSAGSVVTPAQLKGTISGLEERVMSILDGIHVQYDHSHVLLLCHAHEFFAGEQFLLEQNQSVELLSRIYIESGNDRGLYRILRREGRKDPELYVQVLTYFVNKTTSHHHGSAVVDTNAPRPSDADDDDDDDDDEERWSHVTEILALIESENILSIPQVIAILSKNPELPYSILAKYINKSLEETTDELHTLEKDIQSMRKVVDSIVQEDVARKQMGAVGNNQGGKFSKYGGKKGSTAAGISKFRGVGDGGFEPDDEEEDLDYEERELAHVEEQELQSERERWQGIRKAMQERSEDHEAFYAELEQSADGFTTVANFFGRSFVSV